MVALTRRQWYARDPSRQRHLDNPVISVGNLTVGGSGKTPIVEHLARLLLDAGERPAILSRGYARRVANDGVTVVSDAQQVLADVDHAGDEPLMLARALPGVPVLVGANRFVSGRLAEQRMGATVHLLDDGFQHVALGRDVNLLLVDEADLSDQVLPAGRLREPLSAAAAADAVLTGAADDAALTRMRAILDVPTMFQMARTLAPVCMVSSGKPIGPSTVGPVFAVAGIARPQRLFDDLAAAGWRLGGTLVFRDHHRFTQADVTRIADAARDAQTAHRGDHRQGRRTPGTAGLHFAGAGRGAHRGQHRAGTRLPCLACRPTVAGPRPGARRPRRAQPLRAPGVVSVRHRLEFLAVRAVMACVRAMPHAAADACGTALGGLFYLLDRRHRRIALENVAAAFPGRTLRERRTIVRGAFGHFGRLLFAVLKFSTMSPQAMLARVEIEGEDRVRLAHAQNKGVLFVTGHFGFWEIQAMVHALRLPPMAVLARVLDNRPLNDLLEQIRTRTGNAVIYRQGSMRRVMRMLQAGHGVGVLIDQHILSRDAIYVDFFDRPAATTSAVAALAIRTGAPVVPLFALPLGRGRYRMIYEHPVEPPGGADARRRPRVHPTVHRCAGDVCETAPRALAVDAQEMALGWASHRAAIGIRHPVPKALSVTFNPGAACLRLNSAPRTSRRTRRTVSASKPAATIASAGS